MEIRPVVVELFHADRRTDMTDLIVAFWNFAKAPKKLALVCTNSSVMRRSTKSQRVISQYTRSYMLVTSVDILTKL
jgi:hypothetical protein